MYLEEIPFQSITLKRPDFKAVVSNSRRHGFKNAFSIVDKFVRASEEEKLDILECNIEDRYVYDFLNNLHRSLK